MISLSSVKTRIQKLQQLMAKDSVDAVFYATSGNMQYFLGDGSYFWQRTRETNGGKTAAEWHMNSHFLNKPDCILYIPADGEPELFLTYEKLDAMRHIAIKKIPSYFAMLSYAMQRVLSGKNHIAVGESCHRELSIMVGSIDSSIEISDAEQYGEKLRLIKDEGEIEKLRAVAEFTDMSMGIVASALLPGVTPRQVKELIAAIALSHGTQGIAFEPAVIMVRSGAPGSEKLFSYPLDEPLQEGTSITFDYGYVLDGYCSDYGRAFYCGKNDQVRDAYLALEEAQLHLMDRIKPGEPVSFCYEEAHMKLETHGLGKYLRRAEDYLIMGHQIGIDQHERPWLRADEDAVFQPGMVFCLEPKIMWPGQCYLRMEDMVLVTENGCESLTKFDRSRFYLT